MLRSYIAIGYRNLLRHKVYSLVNLVGLALGIATAVLVFMWVRHELSFDRFHRDLDQLFIVGTNHDHGTKVLPSAQTVPAIGLALPEENAQVIAATRFRYLGAPTLSSKDVTFREMLVTVDPSFLELFTFPLAVGDQETALDDPHSMVITSEVAERLFGTENPLGRTVTVERRFDFVITGVLAEVPETSTIRFDILIPMSFTGEFSGDRTDTWFNCSFYTFVKLADPSMEEIVEESIRDRVARGDPETNQELFLAPFSQLRLRGVSGSGGHFAQVAVVLVIGLCILAIACINFMNLATARSSTRAREVGVRKALGAEHLQLVGQFISESVLQSLAALVLAAALVELALPLVSRLSQKNLSFDPFHDLPLLLAMLVVAGVTGVLAGSYPALVLSAFRPAVVLRRALQLKGGGSRLRRALVLVQFTICIALITAMLIVRDQHRFLKTKDLGFTRNQVVYVPLTPDQFEARSAMIDALRSQPGIVAASWSTHLPTGVYWNGTNWGWPGRPDDLNPKVTYLGVSFGYLETMGVGLDAGRFFSADRDRAPVDRVVINSTFARLIGAKDLLGTRLRHGHAQSDGFREVEVIGVVRDFHFKTLHQEIDPLVIYLEPKGWDRGFILVRLDEGGNDLGLSGLRKVWERYAGGAPIEYAFLDQDFNVLYRDEGRVGEILSACSLLAITISCLGLLGLAAYLAEQRTREIAIRRVLGASAPSVAVLLCRELSASVVLANLFAWPVSYSVVNGWLSRFAFRTEIGISCFLLAGLAALALAVVTVSVLALKAAHACPADALREE
jgi:ABC-type antimicrobial peptide transport system permease subunit